MDKRERATVAIHRVACHLQPEELEALAELERAGARAAMHYGINAQLKAHDATMAKIEEILDRLDGFQLDEMAHYIEQGYRTD